MHWLIFKSKSTLFRTTTATIGWLLFSNLHFHVNMAFFLKIVKKYIFNTHSLETIYPPFMAQLSVSLCVAILILIPHASIL